MPLTYMQVEKEIAARCEEISQESWKITRMLEEQKRVRELAEEMKDVAGEKVPAIKRQKIVAKRFKKKTCAGSTMSPVLPASKSGLPKKPAVASKCKICCDVSCHCQ